MVALRRPQLFAPRAFIRKRQGLLALLAAAALISAVGALQVNQLSNATVTSYQINELNRERAAKQAANHELEAEVAGLSSLARVDIEARLRLGLQPATRKLYINVNQPLPAEQGLPTRYMPRDDAQPLPEAPSLWDTISELLPFF
jgi:type II secretory pathway pseudopilin PulG